MSYAAKALVSSSFLALLVACASTTTGVKWEPKQGAPELPARGGGCYVEVYELGKEPTRPYQVVGVLTLKLSADELSSGGGKGVSDRFKKAACEYGVFIVKDIKAYPDTTLGGAEYEAKAAVFLDENGKPILARSGNAAPGASDAGVSAAAGEGSPADEPQPAASE